MLTGLLYSFIVGQLASTPHSAFSSGFPILASQPQPMSKLAFLSMSGSPETVTDLDEVAAGEPDRQADGQTEAAATEEASFFLRRDGEQAAAYAARVFQRVFCDDIDRVLRMEVRVPF
jgi:hypothetical protein